MRYIKKLLPRKRSRFSKRILGFLLIFTLSGVFLQGQVGTFEVHATDTLQDNKTTPDSGLGIDKMGLVEIFDLILKVIYVLLWPLLVVAGWALDNTMVYGSFFHMDAPLWKFWNMIKNFANFALVGVVLYNIIKNLIKGGTKPIEIIKKTLIAGILIQASRFLTAMAVDLSTVATYAVGGLPLSVLQNTDLGDKKILSVHSELDLNKFSNITQKGDTFKVTYGAGATLLSPCVLSDNKESGGSKRYIVGRSVLTGTEVGLCVLFGDSVLKFDEVGLKTAYLQTPDTSETTYLLFSQGEAATAIDATTLKDWVAKGYVVDVLSGSSGFTKAKTEGKTWFDGTDAITMSELVSRSKGFVGPLVTIYSSMLNFAEISDVSVGSIGKISGEMIIKVGIAVALFFPLVALAAVLIMRILFLWVLIAISPFIVLKESFDIEMGGEGKFLGDTFGKSFKLGNILSVIFAPVVTVFALSIALIFMTTLMNTYSPQNTNTPNDVLGPELQRATTTTPGAQKYLMAGGNEIEFLNFDRGGTMDRFSRLIVNLVAIGLIRALLLVAIKANSIGKAFGAPIMNFGKNFMATLPIMPIPGGNGQRVGLAPAIKEAREAPTRAIETRLRDQENEAAEAYFNPNKQEEKKKPTFTSEQYSTIATGGIEKYNEGKEENEKISGTYYSDQSFVAGVDDAIAKISDQSAKDAAIATTQKAFGANIEAQVKDGTINDPSAIKNLIDASDASGFGKKRADDIITNKNGMLVGKKKFKITKNDQGVYEVKEETT